MSSEKEFLEQFINIYQLHPCLWDTKSKEYSNKHMRNEAYNELLDYCKVQHPTATKDFVIKKIHGLRCSFRRELKKVLDSRKKTGSSADDVYVPTLWYYDLLSFISDSETPRQGKCSLDSTDNQVENDDDTLMLEESQVDGELEALLVSPTPGPSVEPVRPSSRSGATPNRPGIKQRQPEKQLIHLATDTLKTYNKRRAEVPSQSIDEFDIAGKKYASDLKGLSNNQRVIAEKLVSEIIFFGKMNQLTPFTNVQLQQFQYSPSNNFVYPHVSQSAQQTQYPSSFGNTQHFHEHQCASSLQNTLSFQKTQYPGNTTVSQTQGLQSAGEKSNVPLLQSSIGKDYIQLSTADENAQNVQELSSFLRFK